MIKKFKRYVKKVLSYFQVKKPVYIPTLKCDLLKNRVALITGGSSGIGLAIAKGFMESGADVIITGRNKSKIVSACDMLNHTQNNTKAYGIVLDNSNVEDINNIINKIDENLPLDKSVDILVNNAGALSKSSFFEVNNDDFTAVIDTNLKGAYFISKIMSKYMIDRKIKGNILNISSSSSNRPAVSAYTMSKWGLKGMTLGFAKSLIDHGIVVNAIAPGPTLTEMIKGRGDGDLNDLNVPAGRLATPEEIANFATILVSDMGRMIVGDTIFMTGGCGVITFDDVNYKVQIK